MDKILIRSFIYNTDYPEFDVDNDDVDDVDFQEWAEFGQGSISKLCLS